MDQTIADFMLLAAKFEFFLINRDQSFAHIQGKNRAVVGINWDRIGDSLEAAYPFDSFNFAESGFQIFKETVPQHLVVNDAGGLKWDSDDIVVSSWQVLLRCSYAQLRNNVAHGNKAQLPAPFTSDRTRMFLEAASKLIYFVAMEHFSDDTVSSPVQFS